MRGEYLGGARRILEGLGEAGRGSEKLGGARRSWEGLGESWRNWENLRGGGRGLYRKSCLRV